VTWSEERLVFVEAARGLLLKDTDKKRSPVSGERD
jgi:hypothetical protein